MRRPRIVLTLGLITLLAAPVAAQSPSPPNQFHPYRGGVNCIQVADRNNNFNCAGGTTVDPTTGNLVIAGTISFTGTGGFAATYFPGVAIGSPNLGAQILGTSDLVLSTSPSTVAPAGPLIRGVTLRVRQGPAGSCQVVVAGGNGFKEYVVPVLDPTFTMGVKNSAPVLSSFPGGPSGC